MAINTADHVPPHHQYIHSFVYDFHAYAREKIIDYTLYEMEGETIGSYLAYSFYGISREIYLSMVLAEAQFLAKKWGRCFRYASMLPYIDGKTFGHAMFEVTVPEDYYLPCFMEDTFGDLLDSHGRPIRVRRGRDCAIKSDALRLEEVK